jgi:uncharacterized membrane protein (UPF0127 family)
MKRLFISMLFLLPACASAAPVHDVSPAVTLHGQHFSVELATNDASRERGLMMRTTLAPDRGMLFVFTQANPQAFWMKNTLIPLDILYFGSDLRLVSMQLNVPPCKADPCPIYPSNLPARYVLELAAGTAHRIGAQVGDALKVEADIGAVH